MDALELVLFDLKAEETVGRVLQLPQRALEMLILARQEQQPFSNSVSSEISKSHISTVGSNLFGELHARIQRSTAT